MEVSTHKEPGQRWDWMVVGHSINSQDGDDDEGALQ